MMLKIQLYHHRNKFFINAAETFFKKKTLKILPIQNFWLLVYIYISKLYFLLTIIPANKKYDLIKYDKYDVNDEPFGAQ